MNIFVIRKVLVAALMPGLIIPMQSSATSPADKHLRSKTVLSLFAAKQIATAAEAEAERNGWKVSIAVVDESGRLIHFLRMDDTTNASVEIAIAKAQHAANYQRNTSLHHKLLEKGNNVVLVLPASMPIEGGVRLLNGGKVIGGIGVTGAQAPEDGQIAQAGADWLAE
jgi:glc operon protein GlcG